MKRGSVILYTLVPMFISGIFLIPLFFLVRLKYANDEKYRHKQNKQREIDGGEFTKNHIDRNAR